MNNTIQSFLEMRVLPDKDRDFYLDLPSYSVQISSTTVVLKVNNELLQEFGIRNGDTLVIDTSVTPKFGDFIVVTSNKKYEVKKIKTINGIEYVLSNDFKLEPISEVEAIVGVVIRLIHKL